MIKKALKDAMGVSIGVTIGSVIIPRIAFPHLYNHTWPSIEKQSILYFVILYVACFGIYLSIEWIKSKIHSK